jgi:hypothetical protein
MPRTITYSLRLEQPNSDGYYQSIAALTDRWTPYAINDVKETSARFNAFRQARGEPVRSEAEYALELLVLGVLLQQSRISFTIYPHWTLHLITYLTGLQQCHPTLEPAIKNLRGILQGIFLRPVKNNKAIVSTKDLDTETLMKWLVAQGENGTYHRLVQWQEYLQSLETDKRQLILRHCLALAERFSVESEQALGEYSAGVEAFLRNTAPSHRWRYDSAFVSRSRSEYHLGMLATETLNRAYRERFRSTQRKVVIVPPCMREQPDEDCKAKETPFGARCQACKPTCRVHQITKMGEKLGFEVFIIPDELRGIGAEVKRGVDSIGLVGVSCALTNWSGGWDAEELGIPAQGTLLDYVGCRYHWDEKGISTDTNLAQLGKMVGSEGDLG